MDVVSRTSDAPGRGGLDSLQPLDVKPPSLTEMVYDSIRASIVAKRLLPGTVVAEAALAARLQVSKTPVREALLRLQSIGLAEPDGARGLRVVSPSLAAIREAYEVREILEEGLARRAAERSGSTECEEITLAAQRSLACAEAGDVQGFRGWDQAFHQAVIAAADNARLAQLAKDAATLASVLRDRDVPNVQDAVRCARQHIGIAEAITRHDPDGAGREARAHVNDVKQMVVAAFRERFNTEVDEVL